MPREVRHRTRNSPAAQMARERPASLGAKLMELYLARDGAAVRALLTPAEPMHVDPVSSSPAAALLAAEQSALLAAAGDDGEPGDLFGY